MEIETSPESERIGELETFGVASWIVHPVTGLGPCLIILSIVTTPGTGYLGLDTLD